jgi:isoquinoline 1-oxidoreductase beta subunit
MFRRSLRDPSIGYRTDRKLAAMQRRDFLVISAGSASAALLALLDGCATDTGAVRGAASTARQPETPQFALPVTAWLTLEADGSARVQVHKAEMGQGVMTALPMLIADELDLPFARVHVELAPGAVAFRDARGNQTTGYSSSVSSSFVAFRTMGAAAREMLLAAAAQRWGVDAAQLHTDRGEVVEQQGRRSRRIGYGLLLPELRGVPVPAAPRLKTVAQFNLIGTRVPRVDTPAKVDGSAQFGFDVRRPGMRVAVIARAPAGAGVARFEAGTALAVRGVERVVTVSSGVAVVAGDFWTALRGRDALQVQWAAGATSAGDSAAHARALSGLLATPGRDARREGQPERIEAQDAGTWLRADYFTPFLAHAALEPLAATAHVQPDRCDLWLGTQAPSRAQNWAAQLTGLPLDRVFVHTLPLGGAFGRRGEWDFAVEAVEVSLATGGPVKVMWTREDDLRHDFYRPATANRLSACIAAAGAVELLTHRIVAPSVARRRSPDVLARGFDFLLTQGSSDLRYAIPNIRVDYHEHDLHVPVGFWRSVGHSHTGFALECFLDEIALAARRDPLALRLELLAGDTRLRAVLQAAAVAAGWGRRLEPGIGLGIACMESYGTRVAQVAEVEIIDSQVRVRRVVCAVDCGQVVNPGIVEQQMHSGIVYGLSAALYGEITFANGIVQQSNYHDYAALRMHEAPRIDVIIVPSDAPPGGCGEPSTPVIAPAVCNAVFAACGQRVRTLPIRLA